VELLAVAHIAEDVVEVTLADAAGLTSLSGSPREIAALCDAMEQAAVLAGASPRSAWLADLPAGDAVVRLGIHAGRVRFLVGPAS
jgi:hypothetical protein